jgi:VIT1/CCC1 family predicted Fe2+/Mn2+ transporter
VSYNSIPTRDLDGARDAYASKDLEASVAAHSSKVPSEELHNKAGDQLKSVVYGGLDGIITTFAVVCGSVGGHLPIGVILVLGFSNLIPNALSMGLGDALSTKAENEYILAEKKREEWEMEQNKQGEIQEMVDIYVERGMSVEDATSIMELLANKYPDLFIEMMMSDELGMSIPDEDENVYKDGAITFCAFIFFGFVPLIGYPILIGSGLTIIDLFVVSCVLTAMTLFLLGCIKTKFSSQKWYQGGLEILIMGSITAAVAFLGAYIVHILSGHAAGTAGAAPPGASAGN